MNKLIEGLKQFVNTVQKDEQELYTRLAESQNPDVLFITCSDSRITPSWVTQTRPGDLFVIRNAGNIIPPYTAGMVGGEAATVEYAVSALKVGHIIVCGHSNCGAMGGLMKLDTIGATLPVVKDWLGLCEGTRKTVAAEHGDLTSKEQVNRAIELNVLDQIKNLGSHPCVAKALEAGAVKLHGWVYDIPSGHVRAYDSGSGKFNSLLES